MSLDYEDLFKEHEALKRKILFEDGQIKHHRFGNLIFYEGMNFHTFKESDMILAHAYLHKSYTMKDPELGHEIIEKLHNRLVDVFNSKSMPHKIFDKLDSIHR